MKNKKFLEKAERVSVIFAAVLGAISFFWQIVEYNNDRQERADIVLWCVVENGNPKLITEIVNTGNRVVYLKRIGFGIGNSPSENGVIYAVNPPIGSETSNLTPIEVGASQEFEFDISREGIEYLANESNLYILIYSPSGEMERVGNLAPYLRKFLEKVDNYALRDIKNFSYNCIKP